MIRKLRLNATHLRLEPLEDRLAPATLLALTTTNSLLRFDSATPGTTTAITVSGLNGGENLLGIDYRPANGQLYAVTSQNRLVTLNISGTTATVSLVAALMADPTDGTNPFTTLNGTSFGVDFNPVPDRLRVVSDTNQNLRINPDTGRVITDADLNPGAPDVVASAYLNNFAGTTVTTLFGLDDATDQLVIQDPPNNGTLAPVGVNLGAGIDVTTSSGFDIVSTEGGTTPVVNTAFASLVNAGVTGLYTIDLTAGTATLAGAIGAGTTVINGLAVVPAGTLNFSVSSSAGNENAGTVTITVTRTGGSLGAVSVDFATASDSATAGQDFTTTTGTLNFADGDTAPKTFTVTLLDDLLSEGNEIIALTLSNATAGAVIGQRSTATLVIRDNDVPSTTLYGVEVNAKTLLEFDSATPGTIRRTTPLVGLNTGDIVQGIDIRPANGKLYALIVNGTASRLATINPTTGTVAPVANLAADPADGTNPFTSLTGGDFGFDFNPTNDRLRITSDANENLLVNPDSGLVTTETDLNPGDPNVVGSAYTNSFVGAGSTTLYAIDSGSDQLFIQNPPGNGTLVAVGALTVNVIDNVGFEINAVNNTGLASLIRAGTNSAQLFSIDLTSGAASAIGTIGSGNQVLNGLTSMTVHDLNLTATQKLVNRIYLDVLGRNADPLGLQGFSNAIDTGVSLSVITTAIVNSTEARTNTINEYFQRYLKRDVQQATLNDLLAVLANGATYDQVLAGIIGSVEYLGLHGNTNATFLAAAYQDLLGRPIDPAGEAAFTALLNAGGSRTTVALGIIRSLESDTREVQELYRYFMLRSADMTGLTAFVGQLQAGGRIESVIAALLASPEYVNQQR